jgi:hypothetical protein
MIVLITDWYEDEKTGKRTLLVSHGVDPDNLRMVVLPQDPPESFRDARYNELMKRWELHERDGGIRG